MLQQNIGFSVSLSSIEVEYVAIAEARKEMIWMADYLEELGKKQSEKILYSDSQSAIQLVKKSSLSFEDKAHQKAIPFHSQGSGGW